MVYIYQYPSLKLVQTLERGTEQAYSAAAFNASGTRLATVGSYPDFMLTVWDWEAGHTLLRSKAFSQEVYNVSFNPYADGSLVTSGELHCLSLQLAGREHKQARNERKGSSCLHLCYSECQAIALQAGFSYSNSTNSMIGSFVSCF